MKMCPRVPANARPQHLPIGGTLILILWQRSFAWPTWVYAVIWTLWGLLAIAMLVAVVLESYHAAAIPESKWREVFKP